MNESGYSLSDIAAVSGGRNNDGMFGGDWSAWIILFLLFGLFGNGNGFGFGGGFGGRGCGQPATTADLTSQSIIGKLDGLTNGLSDSTYAITGAINGLSHQVSDCCCATQRAIDGVNYNMATQACDTRNVIQNSTRDILESNNANTRAILDFLTQDKIATLTAENQNLKLAASQSNQNAVLMAAMDANKAEILRRTGAECPTAAYIVQPPQPVTFPTNCLGQFSGYNGGCGCGCA